jgi:phospholipid transport system substrate-binding protein
MKAVRLFSVSFFVLFLLSSPVHRAYAGVPTDQVKQTVDKVIDILKNKELKKPGKESDRRAAIRKVVGERFDFEEMAKRSLALNWRDRTPDEKKEFVSLFSDLIERAYIRKIEKYTDEKILYTGERIDGEYAVVDTEIVTRRNVETPIEYRLLKKDGNWAVYDVVIEGVSLINNYRTQFSKIIRENSYQELVRRMKNKEEEHFKETK